jgi:HK97 family phage prohead protease
MTLAQELLHRDDLVRSFDSMALDVKPDGLVEALIVPWDRWVDVTEPHPAGNGIVQYRESFARGALDRAARSPGRVGLAFTHSDSFADRLGFGVQLRDSAEGAVATFQLYQSVRDKALDMLATSHRGMSMTFRSLKPAMQTPEESGVDVVRSQVHLRYVAATDCPVYEDAQVLALRDQATELAEQAAVLEGKRRAQAQGLELLRCHGQQLTDKQLAFLVQYRHLLEAADV